MRVIDDGARDPHPETDLGALPDGERTAALERALEEQVGAPFDLRGARRMHHTGRCSTS